MKEKDTSPDQQVGETGTGPRLPTSIRSRGFAFVGNDESSAQLQAVPDKNRPAETAGGGPQFRGLVLREEQGTSFPGGSPGGQLSAELRATLETGS